MDRYIEAHLEDVRRDFFDLLRIPSISTDPAHAGDVRTAAEWVRARMARAGLTASVLATPGHPLVVGRHSAGPDAPTLMVYAHYDVQPPDPLDAWTSPPFEPEVRDGNVFARGAADDKAQVVLQIGAAEAALSAGGLPVNLILLFEGEEEVGSPNLTRLVEGNLDGAQVPSGLGDLHADHVVIADSMMFAPGRPSLIFGMRGLAYLEIEVRTSDHDLHSGQYGGAVPNPAHVLSRIVASFHDESGRVAVPGFYDDVRDVAPATRDAWAALGFDEGAYRATAGGAPLSGEAGFSTAERLWIRPCLDVNGMESGYTGPGKKTVLPASARAKVSCRLVPDQDPDAVARAIRAHVESRVPAGVRVDVRTFQANEPWRADPEDSLFDGASRAFASVYGVPPVRVCHGGTLPIARTFADRVTPSVAVMGLALPGAHMHAPDEWIPLDQLEKGMKVMARLYGELADGAPAGP